MHGTYVKTLNICLVGIPATSSQTGFSLFITLSAFKRPKWPPFSPLQYSNPNAVSNKSSYALDKSFVTIFGYFHMKGHRIFSISFELRINSFLGNSVLTDVVYRVFIKSVCTWWLQYQKNTQKYFKQLQSFSVIT
jgi:hypothetical protein